MRNKSKACILTFMTVICFKSSAFSDEAKKFECTFDKIPGEKVTFSIDGLGSDSPSLVVGNPEDYYPVKTDSKDQTISGLVGTLNGQGGDARSSPKGLKLWGDDDGIDFADFELFADSNYTKGYVSVKHSEGDLGFYSKVSCSVQ